MSDNEEPGGDTSDSPKEKNVFQRLGLKAAQNLGFDKEGFMNTVRIGDIQKVGQMLADPRAVSLGGVSSEYFLSTRGEIKIEIEGVQLCEGLPCTLTG